LELSFGTTQLRDVCERRGVAAAALGMSAALELEQRLADIDALQTVTELASLFPDKITDRSEHEQSLRLQSGHELVFHSGHRKTPFTTDGATDWAKVTRVRIVAIEEAHE